MVNNQRVVFLFQCDLCDASYVGYTARQFHQRVAEHKRSATGRYLTSEHNRNNAFPTHHLFKILKKCKNKWDWLVYEMLFIKDIKPSLNTKSDSIRAKLYIN